MIQRKLLDYLAQTIRALESSLLPEEKTIIFPNEPIEADVYENNVFFEVFTGGVSPIIETEQSVVSSVVGSVVINGKLNAGIGLLDEIADLLVYEFSPVNPNAKKGFATQGSRDENIINVYVTNVERTETGIDDGRFKITIFITFDIYEGK